MRKMSPGFEKEDSPKSIQGPVLGSKEELNKSQLTIRSGRVNNDSKKQRGTMTYMAGRTMGGGGGVPFLREPEGELHGT